MIRHIVLLSWSRTLTEAEINEIALGFDELRESIPEIMSYMHGNDLKIFKGNADYFLIAEFNNEIDLKEYANHPDHIGFMTRLIKPVLGSYKSIQFNV